MAQILEYSSQELAIRTVRAGGKCECGRLYEISDLKIDHSNTGEHDYYVQTTDLDQPSWMYMKCKGCTMDTKLTHVLAVALGFKG